MKLNIGVNEFVNRGPVNLFSCAHIFFLYAQRHRDFSALASSGCVLKEIEQVSWTLPASKADPYALGKARIWGCVCNEDTSIACLHHAMESHIKLLKIRFGKTGLLKG